jgi:hypothetical protein
MPTIIIDGIKYEILREKDFVLTSKEVSSLKHPVTRTTLYLKRPRGKRTYHAVRYENGTISSVV